MKSVAGIKSYWKTIRKLAKLHNCTNQEAREIYQQQKMNQNIETMNILTDNGPIPAGLTQDQIIAYATAQEELLGGQIRQTEVQLAQMRSSLGVWQRIKGAVNE